jgi:ribosomal protein S18 acetylase RimI-like enzyme
VSEVASDKVRRQPETPTPTDVQRATEIAVQPLSSEFSRQTAALLDELRVSLFGVQSARLYATLTSDALHQRIDCRIAIAADRVCGAVLAAPRSYWLSTLVRHAGLALACAQGRLLAPRPSPETDPPGRAGESLHLAGDRKPAAAPAGPVHGGYDSSRPPRTWATPGDAWRIIFVGTAPEARGLGVAAALYRALMRDRSLVARIAADNAPSLRLHRSLGWRLYLDGDVVLALHLKPAIAGT